MQKVLLTTILILGVFLCVGQNTRSAETPKQPLPRYQASKVEKKGLFKSSKKNNTANKSTVKSEVEDFRANVLKRQKANAKKEYKLAKVERREAKKGKSFFGHKRPPKKRPPGKQKFCKVCRLKH